MMTLTNAPTGANTPALSITWHRLSEMWSATSAERAFVGPYELIAFDTPPSGPHPRIIAWEMYTGPKFMSGVAGGPADSFEAAKDAAEQEARRLLTVSRTMTETVRATVARTADSDNPRNDGSAPARPPFHGGTPSTIIPSLGMTFAEGAVKYHALNADFLRLAHADPTGGDNWPDWMIGQAVKIREAMYETLPQTAADAWAVMSVMACRECPSTIKAQRRSTWRRWPMRRAGWAWTCRATAT